MEGAVCKGKKHVKGESRRSAALPTELSSLSLSFSLSLSLSLSLSRSLSRSLSLSESFRLLAQGDAKFPMASVVEKQVSPTTAVAAAKRTFFFPYQTAARKVWRERVRAEFNRS